MTLVRSVALLGIRLLGTGCVNTVDGIPTRAGRLGGTVLPVEQIVPDAEEVSTAVGNGVVSLPTAADAAALFAKFSRQWQRCDGKTLPLSRGVFRLQVQANNVQAATSVLAASISIESNLLGLDSASVPAGRAIGLRGNCLIEVEVDFLNTSTPSLRGSGVVDTSALDIAQIMRDKVGALS